MRWTPVPSPNLPNADWSAMALPKLLGQLQPVDEAESPGPQGIIAGGFVNDSIGRLVLLWDQL